MTSNFPLTLSGIHETMLPVPPPPLHTRSGNEFDRPHTPTQQAFTSPVQTPQGSPSKNRLPPGANSLPDAFENALKLNPPTIGTPNRSGRQAQPQVQTGVSPNRATIQDYSGDVEDSVIHKDTEFSVGSPVRRSNKENTPPGSRLGKDFAGQQFPQSTAAASRQELYQPREQIPPSGRKGYDTQRGLTVEELEKLQKPQVRRLANVTQLCEYPIP
jgi:cell cycle protein kinase DBF2